LQYSGCQIERPPEFYAKACELSLEGIISKSAEAPYLPGKRGLWVKVNGLRAGAPPSPPMLAGCIVVGN
jgi:ATP-dependent DNA ligase